MVGQNYITYTYTDGNGCTNSYLDSAEVIGLPAVNFGTLNSQYCIDNSTPIALTGFPSGGTFSGGGISGSNYTPSTAGVGLDTVVYFYIDGNGCSNADTQIVSITPLPSVTFYNLLASYCIDVPVENLTGFPAGGTFTGTGISGNNFDPAAAGTGTHTITYTYTDGNGCTNDTSMSTAVYGLPTVSFSGLATNYCLSASSAALSGSPSGGAFSGSGISDTIFYPSIAGTGTHNITYTYTDGNGCSDNQLQSVTVDTMPVVGFTGLSASYCMNNAVASLSGTPAGGTFSGTGISGNNFDPAIAGAGNHIITYVFTDGNSCIDSTSQTVTVYDAPSAFANSPTVSGGYNITCNGATDGSINLTVSGGLTAYTYLWSNTATTQNLSGIGAGNYSVTVTDANGCTDTTSATLTEPTVLSSSVTSPTVVGGYNVSCNGGNDGSIDLTVSGGTTAYTYNWSNSMGTEDISTLAAGTYTVTVTDANGCTSTSSITLTESPAMLSTLSSPTFAGGYNVTCFGANDGQTAITPSGGTTPYTYLWDASTGNQTDSTATGLGAGAYSVTITDANACTQDTTITLTEPNPLTSLASSPTVAGGYNITCNGTADGQAITTPSGGTSPYTYLWDAGTGSQTDSTATGLDAGTYSVTITDANSCTTTASVTLTEPLAMSVNATSPTVAGGYNITCNASNDGSIDLTVSGGTTTYSYLWSNSATTEDLSGVGAGAHSVTVTDANGCQDSTNITLTEPPLLTSTAVSSDSITCNGANDGSASAIPSGGTSPYSFQWDINTAGQTDSTATGLISGTYTVTVTDVNGCTSVSNVTITQPVSLSTTISSPTVTGGYNITCNGANDGLASAISTGGTTPYSYQWDATTGNQTDSTATGLGDGTYSVTTTDANGCTAIQSIILTEPGVMTLLLNSFTFNGGYNISCYDSADGSIDLTVSGGTSPFNYQWSNSDTTEDITNLPTGTYIVTVTDANGCVSIRIDSLIQPTPLSASSTSPTINGGYNVSCIGATDGSIDLTVSGGVTSYTYFWSNGENTEDISNLGAGTYTVTITDANGCIATASDTLIAPDSVMALTLSLSTAAGGYNITCNGATNGSIDLAITNGTPAYSYLWSNSATTEDVSGIGAGIYTVTVTDANGCTQNITDTITEPPLLVASLLANAYAGGYNITCNGVADGSIDLTVSGGVAGFTYNWSTSETTEDMSGLNAGSYSVTVTDTNSCVASTNIDLLEPQILSLSVGWIDENCSGGQPGSASVSISGGTAAYTYLWSDGQIGTVASGLLSGTYTVTVTDANGCTDTTSVNIREVSPIEISIAVIHEIEFWENGEATVVPAGSYVPYTYEWSNGQTDPIATGLSAGTYYITVTDDNGCSVSDTATIKRLLSDITIPTAFTPDGDGVNDVWEIDNIHLYPNSTVDVYNRWGGLLFTSDGYQVPWDGTARNGNPLPIGAYYYVIDLGNEDNPFTGAVTIIK